VDITEAAAHLACLLGRRYGVVTTLDRTCGLIEYSLHTAGAGRNCVGVVGVGLGVLELGEEARTASALVPAARWVRDRGAEVLVLGCAEMTGLGRRVSAELGIPVVDGVAAAVRLTESLVRLGLRSLAGCPQPLPKARRWHR
jgi:allantoin racemase